ncbi:MULTISPECIES: hypothetical protein [unclassified Streptomyces]|uniref:hypothetical protein n=1 Tax=unclassified Streptomyces TaxID=2593676 RepID=UPI0033A0B587
MGRPAPRQLASQAAVKQGRTGDAGAYAERAGAVARRTGDASVLAAAARAAATPLRRTGRGRADRCLPAAKAHQPFIAQESSPWPSRPPAV